MAPWLRQLCHFQRKSFTQEKLPVVTNNWRPDCRFDFNLLLEILLQHHGRRRPLPLQRELHELQVATVSTPLIRGLLEGDAWRLRAAAVRVHNISCTGRRVLGSVLLALGVRLRTSCSRPRHYFSLGQLCACRWSI